MKKLMLIAQNVKNIRHGVVLSYYYSITSLSPASTIYILIFINTNNVPMRVDDLSSTSLLLGIRNCVRM